LTFYSHQSGCYLAQLGIYYLAKLALLYLHIMEIVLGDQPSLLGTFACENSLPGGPI